MPPGSIRSVKVNESFEIGTMRTSSTHSVPVSANQNCSRLARWTVRVAVKKTSNFRHARPTANPAWSPQLPHRAVSETATRT